MGTILLYCGGPPAYERRDLSDDTGEYAGRPNSPDDIIYLFDGDILAAGNQQCLHNAQLRCCDHSRSIRFCPWRDQQCRQPAATGPQTC